MHILLFLHAECYLKKYTVYIFFYICTSVVGIENYFLLATDLNSQDVFLLTKKNKPGMGHSMICSW